MMMKTKHAGLRLLSTICFALLASSWAAQAAPVGRATADFDNARPDKSETAWGRLVADALREETHADIALVNAGALKKGTLKAGTIQQADVDALLSFGADETVTMSISGAQFKAALERAVAAFPTGSPSFLHGSGFVATFNPQAPANRRIVDLRVAGQVVGDAQTFVAAMPVALAEGSGGYFLVDLRTAVVVKEG